MSVPAAVVASADEPDPEHPQALAKAYARAIPDARLITDEPGRSPFAWQGSQLSKVIASVAEEAFECPSTRPMHEAGALSAAKSLPTRAAARGREENRSPYGQKSSELVGCLGREDS